MGADARVIGVASWLTVDPAHMEFPWLGHLSGVEMSCQWLPGNNPRLGVPTA